MAKRLNNNEISIIGGAGHVGFPLGLVFASKNFKVNLIDYNKIYLEKISRGIPPFLEKGSKKLLKRCLLRKKLFTYSNYESLKNSKFIVICIGTPIDQGLELLPENIQHKVSDTIQKALQLAVKANLKTLRPEKRSLPSSNLTYKLATGISGAIIGQRLQSSLLSDIA